MSTHYMLGSPEKQLFSESRYFMSFRGKKNSEAEMKGGPWVSAFEDGKAALWKGGVGLL